MTSPKEKDLKAAITRMKRELCTARLDLIKADAVFSSIGEAVIVTDEYGRIEKINKFCRQMLGYSKKEMLGKRFSEMVKAVNKDGSPVDTIDRPITQAFLSGKPVFQRMYYLTKANTPIPVDANISPVIFKGTPIGAIEVFNDLRDEYIKENIQSEFIYSASHQLRTPLSAINTYTQMLSGGFAGKLTDQQNSFVNIIKNSAERMNELIHMLINMTRVEAGNISVNVQNIDLDNICKELIRSLKQSAQEKYISIRYSNNSTPTIKSDPMLVYEVLSNLVSNAIKYTQPNGKISISVKAEDRVIFSVKDNGYGIPVQAQDHVFSKFYRAKNAVETDAFGTGIGLYLARQIAEKLEGDVWFSSKVGKGSTFYFSLPLVGSARKQGKFTLESPKNELKINTRPMSRL